MPDWFCTFVTLNRDEKKGRWVTPQLLIYSPLEFAQMRSDLIHFAHESTPGALKKFYKQGQNKVPKTARVKQKVWTKHELKLFVTKALQS